MSSERARQFFLTTIGMKYHAEHNMLGPSTDSTEGSQEFREILWTLVQEKERDSFVPSSARIWIERLLLVLGFALLFIYGAARLDSFFSSQAVLNRFSAIASLSTSTSDDVAEVVGPSRVDFSLRDGHREQAYEGSPNKPSGAPLAVLYIAKIGLAVPLLDGTDGLTLNHAVGRISGTARPGEAGNIGIAGHRDGFFRGLKDIVIGDTIDLKAPQGTTTYAVDEINIVRPNDASVLGPRPAPSLTLITCYPFYFIGRAPQRYVVHASRIGFEPQKYNSTEQGSLTLANKN
jgi:sortase A